MSTTLTFEIPAGTRQAECRSCRAVVFWITTKRDRKMPVSCKRDGLYEPHAHAPGLGVSHFADCPAADQLRRAR